MTDATTSHLPRRSPSGASMLMAALLFLTLSACDMGPEDFTFSSEDMEALEFRPESGPAPQSPPSMSSEPRLIRTGSAQVEVSELESASSEARQLGEALGGYVAGSQLREGREGARTAALVLRIPSDSLDVLVESLSDLGEVLSVSISTEDVSREYLDVETRLAVQEESVERLRQLAAQGGNLEDLLAAERELSRAVSQLESLKGQIRYYDQRVAESDFRLSLVEPGAVVRSGAFRPLVIALRGSVEIFAQSLANIVYVVVYLAPWIALALLIWPIGRRLWAARRENRAADAGSS